MGSVDEKRAILVTGFGPFAHHTVNASWEAVKRLQQLGVAHPGGTEALLECREISVAYNIVDGVVPKLWKDLAPRLCVHVGVSSYECVKIEEFGSNGRYELPDVSGCRPPGGVCVPGGPQRLRTSVDLSSCVSRAMASQKDVLISTSSDAGQYLCDYIYYTSLYRGDAPVIFVHVPPLNQPYSANQLAQGLKAIIEGVLACWCEEERGKKEESKDSQKKELEGTAV